MKSFGWLIFLLLCSCMLHAQKNYAVMVTDSKTGRAVAGAKIKVLSSSQTAVTSPSGNVVMLISPTDSLLVTAKGYKDRKVLMEGQFVALSIIIDPVTKEKIISKARKKKH